MKATHYRTDIPLRTQARRLMKALQKLERKYENTPEGAIITRRRMEKKFKSLQRKFGLVIMSLVPLANVRSSR